MLRDLLRPRTRLLSQAREIRRLRHKVAELEGQNERMRTGMRRCLSCDYRNTVLEQRGTSIDSEHDLIDT